MRRQALSRLIDACAAVVLAGGGIVGAGTAADAAVSTAACGSLASQYNSAQPPVYQHVVVLMEENWSYRDFVRSTTTPFLTGLSQSCGNETNFHGATHSSQPNYMAATSGIASGVGVSVSNDNIFRQIQASGRTWRAYEESMPAACSGQSVNAYHPGHNPPFYYKNLRSPVNTCAPSDLPLTRALDDDIAGDSLPVYSWITPNECHDFHWESLCGSNWGARFKAGDDWLAQLIPRLTGMPSYQAGQTLILITFDEGSGGTAGVDCTNPTYYVNHPDCDIATVVLSPYLAAGTSDSTDLNLYGLLGTTEDILGVPRLGRAVGQRSMRASMPF